MLDTYYLDFAEMAKIELDAKTAWKIYELLITAANNLPDAAAFHLNQWQGEDDVDFVLMMHAYEDAKMCECYAGAIRGMLCKAISPQMMDILDKERDREYQRENTRRLEELTKNVQEAMAKATRIKEEKENKE